MTITSFVSSTRKDLEDCRATVLRVLRAEGVHPKCMETAGAIGDYTVRECLRWVDESTHFIGVIGFRHGWQPSEEHIPDELREFIYDLRQKCGDRPLSITEIEYHHSRRKLHRRNIAIFLVEDIEDEAKPNVQRWRDGALQHTNNPNELDYQQQFRLELHNYPINVFADFETLQEQLKGVITAWRKLPDGAISDAHQNHRIPPTRTRDRALPPNPLNIGRQIQIKQFKGLLTDLEYDSELPGMAVLIHGESGAGHKELIKRLLQELEKERGPVQQQIGPFPLGSPIGDNGLTRIFSHLSKHLKFTLPDAKHLADHFFQRHLKTTDICLQFTQVEKFDGGLPAFIEQFWTPLAQHLADKYVDRRVVLLLTSELSPERFPSTWYEYLINAGTEALNAHSVQSLATLNHFALDDLVRWYGSAFQHLEEAQRFEQDKPRLVEKARAYAQAAFDETAGQPRMVYHKLQEDIATWM